MDKPRCNRLQIVLFEYNMDQKELAEILSINPNTVSRWCRNETQPSLVQLYNISKLLRINMQRLIEPTDWSSETGISPIDLYRAEKEKQKVATKKKTVKSKRKRRY